MAGISHNNRGFFFLIFSIFILLVLYSGLANAAIYKDPSQANPGKWGIYPNCIAPAIPEEVHAWWDEDANPGPTDDAPRHMHMSACLPNARDLANTLVPKIDAPEHFVVMVNEFNNPSTINIARWGWGPDGNIIEQIQTNFRCNLANADTIINGRPECTWYIDMTLDPSASPTGISEMRLTPNIAQSEGLPNTPRQFLTMNYQIPVAGKSGYYRSDLDARARSWYEGLDYANIKVNYMDFFHGAPDLGKTVPVVSGVVPIKVTEDSLATPSIAIWQDVDHHMDPKFWKTAHVGDIPPSGGKLLFQQDTQFSGTFNWDTRGLADGRHALYFQARDKDNRGIQATAIKLFFDVCNSGYACSAPPQQVATPSISPAGSDFQTSVLVTISTATSGAAIYYTTDASTPTESSIHYTSPISLTQTTTLKARAFKTGLTPSGIATEQYTKVTQLKVATPTIDPNGGTFQDFVDVILTTTTPGAMIHYTLDASTPTHPSSPVYSGPIHITQTSTLKAFAMMSGMADSNLATAIFTKTGTLNSHKYYVKCKDTTGNANLNDYTIDFNT